MSGRARTRPTLSPDGVQSTCRGRRARCNARNPTVPQHLTAGAAPAACAALCPPRQDTAVTRGDSPCRRAAVILRRPMPRLLVSCGEPSGDLYAADLVRHLRGADGRALDVFGLGRRPPGRRGRPPARPRARPRGGRPAGRSCPTSPASAGSSAELLAEVDRAAARPRRPRRLSGLQPAPGPRAAPPRDPRRLLRLAAGVGLAARGASTRSATHVAHMIVIFPFEEDVYAEAGVPVTFVGHPAGGPRDAGARSRRLPRRARARPGAPGDRPAARQPAQGDRATTCRRIAGAVELLAAAAARPAVPGRGRRRRSTPRRSRAGFRRGRDRAGRARTPCCRRPTSAIVASGTATVEAALLGTPMVVVYRLSSLTYRARPALRAVPHVAMANLIAGRRRRARADPGRLHAGARGGRSPAPAGARRRDAMRGRPGARSGTRLGAPGRLGAGGGGRERAPGCGEKALTGAIFRETVSHTFEHRGGAHATDLTGRIGRRARRRSAATPSPRSCRTCPDPSRSTAEPLTPPPAPLIVIPVPTRRPRRRTRTSRPAAPRRPPNPATRQSRTARSRTTPTRPSASGPRCSSSSATAARSRAAKARRRRPSAAASTTTSRRRTRSNAHTQVRQIPRWTFSPASIAGGIGEQHAVHADRHRPAAPGTLTAYCEADGIRSNNVRITIR